MFKCMLCGSTDNSLYHKGTRDVADIDVYRCNACGLLFLSKFPDDVNQLYEDGNMHLNGYDEISDTFTDISYEKYVQLSERDDLRRYNQLKDICKDKNILEFGCGNGGFLKKIKKEAASVTGIELERRCSEEINSAGIKCVDNINRLNDKYDIVVSFNVIEHLTEPRKYLDQIYDCLTDGGVFICETCNADDALITYYNCDAYRDFTFWSEHVYLYNSETLERLINSCGFKTLKNTQIQRYPLSNHLYWLGQKKPGGHNKYTEFNDEFLNKYYVDVLRKMKKCDTLFAYFTKG